MESFKGRSSACTDAERRWRWQNHQRTYYYQMDPTNGKLGLREEASGSCPNLAVHTCTPSTRRNYTSSNLGVGIRFFLLNRFGFIGFLKCRFSYNGKQKAYRKVKNRGKKRNMFYIFLMDSVNLVRILKFWLDVVLNTTDL